MPDIATVWKDFISKVLFETFGEFLNENELKERRDWILANIMLIDPDLLYKNFVYMLSNNSISEIAIGYKLHFLLDDWKALFKDPYSEEYDRNPNLSEEDKKTLDRIVDQFGSVINHHMELLIHSNNYKSNESINNLINTVKELANFYELPDYNAMNEMHIVSDHILYKFDIGQILYFVSFNQNPIDGTPCEFDLSESIRSMYPQRLMMMDTLKKNWPMGIPLKYVQSKRIF